MRLVIGILQILLGIGVLALNAFHFLDMRRMMSAVEPVPSLHDGYLVTSSWAHYLPQLFAPLIILFGGWLLIKDHKLLGATHGSR